jgi:hypothetical protein
MKKSLKPRRNYRKMKKSVRKMKKIKGAVQNFYVPSKIYDHRDITMPKLREPTNEYKVNKGKGTYKTGAFNVNRPGDRDKYNFIEAVYNHMDAVTEINTPIKYYAPWMTDLSVFILRNIDNTLLYNGNQKIVKTNMTLTQVEPQHTAPSVVQLVGINVKTRAPPILISTKLSDTEYDTLFNKLKEMKEGGYINITNGTVTHYYKLVHLVLDTQNRKTKVTHDIIKAQFQSNNIILSFDLTFKFKFKQGGVKEYSLKYLNKGGVGTYVPMDGGIFF